MVTATTDPVPGAQVDEPGAEEKRALIERVASSEHIQRSARLHDFLLYVGTQSLKDGRAEIKEQEIGAKVFGRSATYDRSQDNIVRVNATELRKRIEHYFAKEGAHEPWVFEIPRGGYKLVFHPRAADVGDASSNSAESAPERADLSSEEVTAQPESNAGRVVRYIWPALCIALAIMCAVLYRQNQTLRQKIYPLDGQPALDAFWSGFLNPQKQTDLVLPDDSASVIEDVTGTPISLQDYLTREFLRRAENSNLSADRKQDIDQIFSHNLVTFGGVRAAQLILGKIPPDYPRYLTMTRSFSADELNRDNVVLIGGQKSVPWVHLFDNQINFVTDYDYQHGLQIVRNRKPAQGEPLEYVVAHTGNNLYGFATIAYISNPSQTGNVLILGGTDSDATGAAAAFLTSEEHMEKLRRALHVDKKFPYFEVLLKISRLSGTFFDEEPIAYRSY